MTERDFCVRHITHYNNIKRGWVRGKLTVKHVACRRKIDLQLRISSPTYAEHFVCSSQEVKEGTSWREIRMSLIFSITSSFFAAQA